MKSKGQDELFSDEETMKRREEALKKMLSTAHKPHAPVKKREAKHRQVRPLKKSE